MSTLQEVEKHELINLPNLDFQYCFEYQDYERIQNRTPRLHIHDCYEIYVNISGDMSFLVNNSLYAMQRGDVLITRPGDVHICINQAVIAHTCFCFWFQCLESSPLIAFTKRKDFNSFIRYSEDTKKELLQLLYRLKDAQEATREPERTICLFRLLTLFAESTYTEPKHPRMTAGLQNVLDYINENYTQIHCVDDIVKATHISSPTMNRWFRANLQLSPHKYVEALKLSSAQRLLLEGKTVTEACNSSGFSDYSRFISVFKKKFGQTPLQYQKHHK